MQKHSFSELGISAELLRAIESLGFEQPAPIQEQAIPIALEGRDIVGQSQTGSGKTMAFGIPVVQRIDASDRRPQALILCPTRELAMQVCAEIHKLAGFAQGVRATPIYGGASYDRQIRALQQGSQIVVGTPGRVLDFVERGMLKLDSLRMLVFDEADEMLDMGFRDEIDQVMAAVPAERQTIFFSATFSGPIRDLIERYTRDPAEITIEHKMLTVPTIEQRYYEVHGRSKLEALCRVLDIEAPRLTIVFANTKKTVDDVTDALVSRGFTADRLHGDLNQIMRERVMRNFRNQNIEVLVATDVAARGLDVNDVDLIVNFDLPYDEEDYVHRIGRTGRAGKSGKAVSLVAGREIYLLQRIQRYINSRVTRAKVPSQEEVEEKRVDQSFEKLKATLEAREFTPHEATIQRLLDAGFTSTEIASAVLDLWLKESAREGEQIMEDRKPKAKATPGDKPRRAVPPPSQGQSVSTTAETAPAEGASEPISADTSQSEAAAPKVAPAAESPSHFDEDAGHERPRPRRESRQSHRGPRSGMVRLFVNLGGMDGVRPGDIAGMIYNTAKLAPGTLGNIEVYERNSFVEVPGEQMQQIIDTVSGAVVRGRKIRMDVADRPAADTSPRPRRFGGKGGGPGFGRPAFGKPKFGGKPPFKSGFRKSGPPGKFRRGTDERE